MNNLIEYIDSSNKIISSLKEEDNDFKEKSDQVYNQFKNILTILSDLKLRKEIDILKSGMKQVSKINNEYERIKYYQKYLKKVELSFKNNQIGGTVNEYDSLITSFYQKIEAMTSIQSEIISITNIISELIGNVSSPDGLYVIRIKIEKLVENFTKTFGSAIPENVKNQFDGILKQLDDDISQRNVVQDKLFVIKESLKSFVNEVGKIIDKNSSIDNIATLAQDIPTTQPIVNINNQAGGSLDEKMIETLNICKNKFSNLALELETITNNNDLYGGGKSWNRVYSLDLTIEKALGELKFARNLANWELKNSRHIVTLVQYYYFIVYLLEDFIVLVERYGLQKLFSDLLFIQETQVNFLLKKIFNNYYSNLLSGKYERYNQSNEEAIKFIQKIREKPLCFNIFDVILTILVNNFSGYDETKFKLDLNYIKNIYFNLLNLFHSLRILHYLNNLIKLKELLSEEKKTDLEELEAKLQSLLHTRNLILEKEEYLKLKESILDKFLKKLFYEVLSIFSDFKSNCINDFKTTILQMNDLYFESILGIYKDNVFAHWIDPYSKKVKYDLSADKYQNMYDNLTLLYICLNGKHSNCSILKNIMDIILEEKGDLKLDKKFHSKLFENLFADILTDSITTFNTANASTTIDEYDKKENEKEIKLLESKKKNSSINQMGKELTLISKKYLKYKMKYLELLNEDLPENKKLKIILDKQIGGNDDKDNFKNVFELLQLNEIINQLISSILREMKGLITEKKTVIAADDKMKSKIIKYKINKDALVNDELLGILDITDAEKLFYDDNDENKKDKFLKILEFKLNLVLDLDFCGDNKEKLKQILETYQIIFAEYIKKINEKIRENEKEEENAKKLLREQHTNIEKIKNEIEKMNEQLEKLKGDFLTKQQEDIRNKQEELKKLLLNYDIDKEKIAEESFKRSKMVTDKLKFLNLSEKTKKSIEKGKLELTAKKTADDIKSKIQNNQSLEDLFQELKIDEYKASKKHNQDILILLNRMIAFQTNAIQVYVKGRHEESRDTTNYYEKSDNNRCMKIKIEGDEAKSVKYGQFVKIYDHKTTIEDLYCGENVRCDKQQPLTNSIRDTLQLNAKATTYFTEGFSGSGKTTLLIGHKNNLSRGNQSGIISRLLVDNLTNKVSGIDDVEIEFSFLLGEIYGEKQTLSITDCNYAECMILWKVEEGMKNPKEYEVINLPIYKSENNKQTTETFLGYLDKPLSLFQKRKYFNQENIPDDEKIMSTADVIKKFAFLDSVDSEYEKQFFVEVENKDNPKNTFKESLYSILSGETRNKETDFHYSVKTKLPKEKLKDFTDSFSVKLDNLIDEIQKLRRKQNRVRCTRFNPDSSRSHMFYILKVKQEGFNNYKYFTFVDKAGNEIPYNIAISECKRLAKRDNPETILFTVKLSKNDFFNSLFDTSDEIKQKIINNFNGGDMITPGTLLYLIESKSYEDTTDENNLLTIPLKFTFKTGISAENPIQFKLKLNVQYINKSVGVDATKKAALANISHNKLGIDYIEVDFEFKFESLTETFELKHRFKEDSDEELPIKIKEIVEIFESKNKELEEKKETVLLYEELSGTKINSVIEELVLYNKYDPKNKKRLIPDTVAKFCERFSDLKKGLDKDKDKILDLENLFDFDFSTSYSAKKAKKTDELLMSKDQFTPKTIELSLVSKKLDDKNLESYLGFTSANMSGFKRFWTLDTVQSGGGWFMKMLPSSASQSDIEKFNINKNDFFKNLMILINPDTSFSKTTNKLSQRIFNIYELLDKLKTLFDSINPLNPGFEKFHVTIQQLLFLIDSDYIIDPDQTIGKLRSSQTQDTEVLYKPDISSLNLAFIESNIRENKTGTLIFGLFEELLQKLKSIILDLIDENTLIQIWKETLKPALEKKIGTYNSDNNFTVDKYREFCQDVLNLILKETIDLSLFSAVDKNFPSVYDMQLNYSKLLASFLFQKIYLSNMKKSNLGCNNTSIIDASNYIIDTLSLLFEDSKLGGSFRTNNSQLELIIAELSLNADGDYSFNSNEIKDKSYLEDLSESFNKMTKEYRPEKKFDPQLLATLSKDFSDKLKFSRLKLLKDSDFSIKVIENTSDIKASVSIKPDSLDKSDENFEKDIKKIINFILRLILISKLCVPDFNFLDIFSKTKRTTPLDFYSDKGLINVLNKILMNDFDGITYKKEFRKYLNITDLVNIQSQGEKSFLKSTYERANENFDQKPYIIWELIANIILPSYLLNVSQGFWINHSIRILMQAFYFSVDEENIKNNIFANKDVIKEYETQKPDENTSVTDIFSDQNIPKLFSGLNPNDYKLLKSVRPLKSTLARIKSNSFAKSDFIQQIMQEKESLEEYYLDEFDTNKSLWVKLLFSMQHLGASINPVEYSQSKQKTVNDKALNDELKKYLESYLDELKKETTDQNVLNKLSENISDIIKKLKIEKIPFEICKLLVLILAYSDEPRKVKGVSKTFEFASLLTEMSNADCKDVAKFIPIQ